MEVVLDRVPYVAMVSFGDTSKEEIVRSWPFPYVDDNGSSRRAVYKPLGYAVYDPASCHFQLY